jgi:hypothetical protein
MGGQGCYHDALYDHRQSLPFDFNQDGEQKNLAQDSTHADILTQLYGQLVSQYTYPLNWLDQRHRRFLNGEKHYMAAFGFDSELLS